MRALYRDIVARAKRYDKWAQNRRMKPRYTQSEHDCVNCDTHYQGNYCPQCGLKASLSQMRMKSLALNFMDMWGLGSRPIFRTIGQLFTRPGYMMRDYLSGHQPLFFPPFKMLMVVCLIFALSVWLRDANLEKGFSFSEVFDQGELSARGIAALAYFDRVAAWFSDHLVFRVLLIQLTSVTATRIAFRACAVKWTYVELFFAQIYMQCQYYIFEIASVWLLGNDMDDAPFGFVFFHSMLLYQWLTYAQLYNLGFWRSLWLSIKKVFWFFLILIFLGVLLVAFFFVL